MAKSNYDPNIHNRKSQRLKGYDYSKEGLYFITICCKNMEHRFGKISQNENSKEAVMEFNGAGKIINTEWIKLKNRYQNIELHEFQTMSNHFHGIIEILDGEAIGANTNEISVGAYPCGRPTVEKQQPVNLKPKGQPQGHAPSIQTEIPKNKTISDMLDAFKSITTLEYIHGVDALGWERFEKKIWQRNFHDHIIRDEKEYLRISNYIINNPSSWANDKFNPKNL